MKIAPSHLVVAAVAALVAFAPPAATAQQPTGAGAGIWIAGPDGRLRNVEPVRAPLTTSYAPARAAVPAASGVRLVLEVEHHARSASGAVAGGEMAVGRVASALGAFGISPADISAEAAWVQPRRERRLLAGSWEQPRIAHYESGHLVTVTVREPARIGLLIDHAMGAGATRVVAMDDLRAR
jgi:uncharacterized protein YggE